LSGSNQALGELEEVGMSRRFGSSLQLVTVTALAAALACGDPATGPGGTLPPPRPLTAQESQLSAANTSFGLELLRRVHLEKQNQPNVLLSPLSVSMALGMVLNGARGTTYQEMQTALGLGGLTEDEVNRGYRGLIDQLRARDPRVEFRLANSIWTRQGFPFETPFLEASQSHFDARVSAINFDDPAAPALINRWADEMTAGRIRQIVDAIDPLDIMFLLNAVYFKAPWSSPFEPNATSGRAFRTLDRRDISVPTMMRDGATLSYQDAEVTVVDLPYADSAFSMTLLLPGVGRSLDELIQSLSADRWAAWTGSLTSGRVMLLLPKWRFEFDVGLIPSLGGMGVDAAFRPFVADFGRITTARNDVYISGVRHKAFIDVHELGTEAAAVTSITVSVTSMPPVIAFDRAFLFVIRERETGTILFLGRVGDPSAG
jgi:serine protease inhibitor